MRETSGFVANALIPVPWKTLLRLALGFAASSEGKSKSWRGKSETERSMEVSGCEI